MKLFFLTGSKNKLAEVRAVLPQVEQLEINLPEIQELDPHKIIAAKLFEASKHQGNAYIVEDTSLYLDALNGLYKIAQSFGSFGAQAKTIIGYADGKGAVEFFEGVVQGTIVAPSGDTDFGWDPIFKPEGHAKTFAEMSAEEKNSISMRRLAVEKLKTFLTK